MRILTLSNTPLDEALGSGYVVMRYVEGLRGRGHQVEVRGPADYEPLNGFRRAIRYRQAIGMAVASLRRLASSEVDVIEYYGGESWLAISGLARLPGRRFLLVSHSNGIETHSADVLRSAAETRGHRRWYQLEARSLVARAFREADAIVTVAQYDRDYALRQGYATAGHVLAIDNPLPDSFLGLDVDFARGPVIGYCGSWLPRKGAAMMERDLPPLLRDFPAWRLALVGVGAAFAVADHFPQDVLAQITVIPHADRETELRRLYQTFAIAIMPSIYESFGLSAAEAMACGCALVAAPVGFAASLQHAEEAYLTGGQTERNLYESLKTMIVDQELRQRIAQAGYRRAQRLRWDSAIDEIESAYLRWLAELRRSAATP